MNFKKIINKLIDNKNVYYVMICLTIIHIIAYFIRKTYNVIWILFLSAIIIYNFTKNKTLILLISLIVCHIYTSTKNIYEGLENNNDSATKVKNAEKIDKLKNTDAELGTAAEKLDDENKQKIVDAKTSKINKAKEIKDQNNPDMNETTETTNEPVPESFEGGKKGTVRLDHAATIETAYSDLENILGSDGITKLTDDTKKLMNQQKNLFQTMNQLAPAVKETMSMLEGMDLNKYTNLSSTASDIQSKLKTMLGSGNNVKASNDKTTK